MVDVQVGGDKGVVTGGNGTESNNNSQNGKVSPPPSSPPTTTTAVTNENQKRPKRKKPKKKKVHNETSSSTTSSIECYTPLNHGSLRPRSISSRTLRKLCTLVTPSLFPSESKGFTTYTSFSSNTSSAMDLGASTHSTSSVITNTTTATTATTPTTNVNVSSGNSVSNGSITSPPPPAPTSSEKHTIHSIISKMERVSLAACNPLIILSGLYILVPLENGCLCVYCPSPLQEEDEDEDVLYSQREEQSDYDEEDGDYEEEVMQKLQLKEEKREHVGPILTIGPLCFEGEESGEGIVNIVDMCGTNRGTSLIQTTTKTRATSTLTRQCNKKTDTNQCKQQQKEEELTPRIRNTSSSSSSGKDEDEEKKEFLGHVAVLTSDGNVYILEFLHQYDLSLQVDIVCTFTTYGYNDATCICLHDASYSSNNNDDEKEGNKGKMRLCIGHESGLITDYEVRSVVEQTVIIMEEEEQASEEDGNNTVATNAKKETKEKDEKNETKSESAVTTVAKEATGKSDSEKSTNKAISSSVSNVSHDTDDSSFVMVHAAAPQQSDDGDNDAKKSTLDSTTKQNNTPNLAATIEKSNESIRRPSPRTITATTTIEEKEEGDKKQGEKTMTAIDGGGAVNSVKAAITESAISPSAAASDNDATPINKSTPGSPTEPTNTSTTSAPPSNVKRSTKIISNVVQKPKAHLKWRAHINSPVTSLSSLGYYNDNTCSSSRKVQYYEGKEIDSDDKKQVDKKKEINNAEANIRSAFLAVGILQRRNDDNYVSNNGEHHDTSFIGSSSSSFEVVNVSMIEQDWIDYVTSQLKNDKESKSEIGGEEKGTTDVVSSVGEEEKEERQEQQRRQIEIDNSPHVHISLDDNDYYYTWAGAGMEIRDNWTWSSSSSIGHDEKKKNPVILGGPRDSCSTSSMCCSSSSHEANPFVAMCTSDGTMNILHSIIQHDNNDHYYHNDGENDDKEDHTSSMSLSWGVANDLNQVVFGVPCIAMGLLDDDDEIHESSQSSRELGNSTKYIACCQRGGTVFLVPVCSPLLDEDEDHCSSHKISSNVFMYDCPVDLSGDEDGLIRYVQGFTAGHIQLSRLHGNRKETEDVALFEGRDCDCNTKPILVYAWAGGMLDIYECTSLETSKSAPMKSYNGIEVNEDLEVELLHNGTLHLFIEQLLGMDESDSLLLDCLWQGAWEECKAHCDTSIESVVQCVIRDFDEQFKSTRHLLSLLSMGRGVPNYQ